MTLRARVRTIVSPCPVKDLDVRVTQVSGERGWDLYVLTAPDPALVAPALEKLSAYMDGELEVISQDDTSAMFRGRHMAQTLFETIREARCMVLWPAHYHRGVGELDVIAPDRAALSELHEGLGPTTIEAVREVDPSEYEASVTLAGLTSNLTRRQFEVLEAAVDGGLYEIPRRTKVEELAEAFDIAPSTLAEHLRKAESVAVREFAELVNRHPALFQSGFKGRGRPPENGTASSG